MIEQVLIEDGVECANHSGTVAEGNCSVCGKPVCADCFARFGSEVACDQREHRLILEQWSLVFCTNPEFEADMIVKNLENEAVEVKRYSSRVFKRSIGENSRDFVKVFVRSEDHGRAELVLRTLGLLNVETVNQ
jgi:hypothetical protein